MALLQLLLTLLSRTTGRVFNTAFAWATITLFGRVPPRRQIYLSMMSFAALAWLIAAMGIAFPSLATFLVAFVTIPAWVHPGWIRLAMAVITLVSPLAVGALCLLAFDPLQRPRTLAGRTRTVLKGYPVTIGLAVTLVWLLFFAPVMQVRAMAWRWTTTHVPVLVEAHSYSEVLRQLRRSLAESGWRTQEVQASWMIRVPIRIFSALAGDAGSALVAERLATLRSTGIEVTLHPSDLILAGPATEVARARAALAESMAFSALYMTWTTEGRLLEDWLRRGGRRLEGPGGRRHARSILRAIERGIRTAHVPFEEWEVLFRKLLLLERRLSRSGEAARGAAPLPSASGASR